MEPAAYRQMAETEDRHWWFCGRRAIASAVIDRLDLPADAGILEIGAGTGGNFAMLSRHGTVTAVEMNDMARSIAREKTGARFLDGALPDRLPVSGEAYDLVCLFDVLEHVAEDLEALRALERLVKPGGRVLLTVPAHQWLWSRHDVDLHHFRRYSRGGLSATAREAGFRVERLTYTNAAFFPLAVVSRLADRLLGHVASSGSAVPPRPINAAMKTVFSAERHVVRNAALPFGVSLLAVLAPQAERRSGMAGDRLAA